MKLTKQDEGKIVYFMMNHYINGCSNVNISVEYGRIDEVFEYDHKAVIDYLYHPDFRYINGIPIKEFTETRRMKLPKGWNYNTELYKEKYIIPEEYRSRSIDFKNPLEIKRAYEEGYLILQKDSHDLLYKIEVDISKDGYKVNKKCKNSYERSLTHNTYDFDKLYGTYNEALKAVENEIAELERQSNLSDLEWSIEQIEKTLNHWQKVYCIPDGQKQKTFDELMTFKDVENLEVRLFGGNIQWKYWKGKRWNNIVLE